MKTFLFLITLSFLSISVNAQNKKAQRAFELGSFETSVSILEEDKVDGKISSENLKLLCISYFYLGKTEMAEETAMELFQINSSDPSNAIIYAKCLMANKQYEMADDVLSAMKDLYPDIEEIERASRSLEAQQMWFSDSAKVKVKPADLVNSVKSDYSPHLFKDKLVFCSLDKKQLINSELIEDENNFSGLYAVKLNDSAKERPKPFFASLIEASHVGPVCFSKDGLHLYFTKSTLEHGGVNYLKIYYTDKIDGKWEKPKAFEHNSSEYNVAYPAFSNDGRKLFFSSDQPGGQGGMDLYYCIKTEQGWSAPISLGNTVNTFRDEVFPSYFNGYLYFASDGHIGYGSLDMFKVKENVHWDGVENLRMPFNTPFDDFGIIMTGEQQGYFTSNRPGGMGKDDIYSFKLESEPDKIEFISGIFEDDGRSLANEKIYLIDEFGEVIQEAYTDKDGKFSFDRKKGMSEYSIQLAKPPVNMRQMALKLTNSKGEITELIKSDANGKFNFEVLELDDFDDLALMEETESSFLQISISGQVFYIEPGDFTDSTEIMILDNKGVVLEKVNTGKNGRFLFQQVDPDDEFVFKLGADDPNIQIAVLEEDGTVKKILKMDENMRFIFERLDPDDHFISLLMDDDSEIIIKEDENFVINNIYYDLNSTSLKEDSKKELDKIIYLMYNNDHIGIELEAHTDSRASDQYNLNLSQERANSARNYLIAKGVDAARIRAIGYGESRLINECNNSIDCPESQHAQNRRSEIKIFSVDN